MCKECGCGEHGTQRQEFLVEGMSCGNCTAAVEKALLSLPGVLAVTVDLAEKKAVVDYKPTEIDAKAIIDAIEGIGFEASARAVVAHAHKHGVLHTIAKFFK